MLLHSDLVSTSTDLLEQLYDHAYASMDSKHWVCKTCDAKLTSGVLPLQAKANGIEIDSELPELSCLNALEKRLVSLHVPFMKITTRFAIGAKPELNQVHHPLIDAHRQHAVCSNCLTHVLNSLQHFFYSSHLVKMPTHPRCYLFMLLKVYWRRCKV